MIFVRHQLYTHRKISKIRKKKSTTRTVTKQQERNNQHIIWILIGFSYNNVYGLKWSKTLTLLLFFSLSLTHIYDKHTVCFIRTWTLSITTMTTATALSPKKRAIITISTTPLLTAVGNNNNETQMLKELWTDFKIIYVVYSVHVQFILLYYTYYYVLSVQFFCFLLYWVGWQTVVSVPLVSISNIMCTSPP